MNNHLLILRKVGWTLIIIGLIDIGIMIYCMINKIDYSSVFNIFAVIAGILLLRKSLKTARIISWVSALFLAIFAVCVVAAPFLMPMDLLFMYVKLTPLKTLLSAILAAVVAWLLIWFYINLTSPAILSAMDEAQINYKSFWKKPSRGFWVGGCLSIILFALLFSLTHGETANLAKQRAISKAGKDYKFHVKSINVSASQQGKKVYAVVTAYNNKEIKDIVVEWSE